MMNGWYDHKDLAGAEAWYQVAKEAGYSCREAKDAGYSPLLCRSAGFSYSEGRACVVIATAYSEDG